MTETVTREQQRAWKGSVKYFSGRKLISGLTTHAFIRVLYIVEAFIILYRGLSVAYL